MRVLSLSNFYPPHSRGGYELWCQEVADGLRARGHDVSVVTSRYGTVDGQADGPPDVHRVLRLEMELASRRNAFRFFTSRRADERENLARLSSLVERANPDCILIWGMWNIHRSVAALAERLRPSRVAYYVGDYWPSLPSQFEAYWESPSRGPLGAVLKAPLRPLARRALGGAARPTLAFRHAMFPTAFMRDELARLGFRAAVSRVVYGAIDTGRHDVTNGQERRLPGDVTRLLYVGRLVPDKGVHVAIEALGALVRDGAVGPVTLAIVGSGEASYEARLEALARQHGVAHLVRFAGAQPPAALPGILEAADIFLFTSIWPEPFGRALVEAMASRLAVVGTATGGAAEILADGSNALVVAPGDVHGLAGGIARLVRSPALRQSLAARGRRDALERFDIRRMTLEIEQFLQELVAERRADASLGMGTDHE